MALFGTPTPMPVKAPISSLFSAPAPAMNAQTLAPVINVRTPTSGTVGGLINQAALPQTNTATKGAVTGATSTNSAAAPKPAVTWNQDTATSVGQLLGLLQPGQTAVHGFLDQKIAGADPALQAEYAKIANGIQQGTMTQDDLLNHFIDRQAKTATNDPAYGSLAKAPYETFKPYSAAVPEFKPFAMSDFIASPDYQFRLEQGQNAIDRAGSARGNFYSGGALKESAKFGSDLASGEFNNARNNYNQDFQTKYGQYGDAYNRYNTNFGLGYGQATQDSNTIYNRYAGLAGQGSGTANAAVANNNNNSNLVGTTLAASAQNQANAGIQGSNNLTQLIANLGRSQYGVKS